MTLRPIHDLSRYRADGGSRGLLLETIPRRFRSIAEAMGWTIRELPDPDPEKVYARYAGPESGRAALLREIRKREAVR